MPVVEPEWVEVEGEAQAPDDYVESTLPDAGERSVDTSLAQPHGSGFATIYRVASEEPAADEDTAAPTSAVSTPESPDRLTPDRYVLYGDDIGQVVEPVPRAGILLFDADTGLCPLCGDIKDARQLEIHVAFRTDAPHAGIESVSSDTLARFVARNGRAAFEGPTEDIDPVTDAGESVFDRSSTSPANGGVGQ